MTRTAWALISLFTAWAFNGCADPRPPRLSVIDAAVTQRTPDGTVITFDLIGENPNAEPLPLDEVRYSLSLEGREVFSGTRHAQATLPARGVQRVRLPVAVPSGEFVVPDLGQSRYRLSGSLVYRIPGSIAEVFFDAGLRRPSTGFSESGTLEFSHGGGASPATDR